MDRFVSKSSFKARALEYFREVESTGRDLIITDHGKPVLKIVPYAHDPEQALAALRGSVLRYTDPFEPGDRTAALKGHPAGEDSPVQL